MNRMFARAGALLLALAPVPALAMPPPQDGGLDFDRPVEVRVELALPDTGTPGELSGYLERQGFRFHLALDYTRQDAGPPQSTGATLTATREGVMTRQQLEDLVARVAGLAASLPAPPEWTVRQVLPFPGGTAAHTLRIGAQPE